jgi:DNA polymerase-3 subunit gamma/tau
MRDAESALDQAISFYGDRVSEADVLSLFGLTGFGPVAQLGRALAAGDVAAVLKAARELAAAGKDLAKLSQDLLGFFRNLVIYQVSPHALEGDISAAESSVLAEVAPQISRGAALNILEELSHLEGRLRYALAKDVVFEVALIQMSQLREKISLEGILESLGGAPTPTARPPSIPAKAPAPHVPAPVTTNPAPMAAVPVQPANVPGAPPVVSAKPIPAAASSELPMENASSVVTTAAAQKAWTVAAENFAAARPLEADTIRAVEFHTCKADMLEVMLPKALEKKLFFLRSPRNLELLEQSLQEQLGRKLQLVFLVGESRKSPEGMPAPSVAPVSGKPAPPPPNMSQEAFLNDPVIQNALKIFEAKVVAPARS